MSVYGLLTLGLALWGCPFTSGAPTANLAETLVDHAIEKRQFATFGPHVSMGQTESEYIEMTTVFMPGRPPAEAVGSLFVWPGLFDQKNRSEGDLVQTVAEYHSPLERQRKSCDAQPGQWCIRPFIVSHGYVSQTVPVGLSIDGTDQIKINYKKAPGDNGQWTQTLWNLSQRNQQLFSYVRGSASCKWFEIATESQEGNKGSADVQNYYNTTLVLKNPDPQLGTRFLKTGSITTTNPVTSDGGKTWFIEKVTIPPMLPPGQEFKPPSPPPLPNTPPQPAQNPTPTTPKPPPANPNPPQPAPQNPPPAAVPPQAPPKPPENPNPAPPAPQNPPAAAPPPQAPKPPINPPQASPPPASQAPPKPPANPPQAPPAPPQAPPAPPQPAPQAPPAAATPQAPKPPANPPQAPPPPTPQAPPKPPASSPQAPPAPPQAPPAPPQPAPQAPPAAATPQAPKPPANPPQGPPPPAPQAPPKPPASPPPAPPPPTPPQAPPSAPLQSQPAAPPAPQPAPAAKPPLPAPGVLKLL